jgi:purine-nucleoside phosphorylase
MVGSMLPESFSAEIGLVAGSGLGGALGALPVLAEVPFDRVPGLPAARVPGHRGSFALLDCRGVRVLAMFGRVHLYEGHAVPVVTAGIRALAGAGAKAVLLTNAAGGIRGDLAPGRFMRIDDQINLTGTSPLEGGPNFIDMSRIYDPALAAALAEAATAAGIELAAGVYAGVRGPQYESPAEVRMLRTLGADAVGMSTVLEAIAARALGMRVAGLSLISNFAAGVAAGTLDHTEVMAAGRAAQDDFGSLIGEFLPRAAAAIAG